MKTKTNNSHLSTAKVQTGLDVLHCEQFAGLKGKRVGLLTHPAALSQEFFTATQLFEKYTCLTALFGPEHGFRGEAQDLIPVSGGNKVNEIPCYSLYGDSFDTLKPTAKMLENLDILVVDMQDVGSRYYTFQATMLYCMEACEQLDLPLMVLDRPNPIGSTVEGPTIVQGFESFVGPHPIAIRHGMTMCELAKLYQAERTPRLKLETVHCKGWDCKQSWPDGKKWFPPSPNMPTVDTAIVYPGGCLYEGTNLSEGRGTTRPFEYVGHPEINEYELVRMLNEFKLPGVTFLPVSFRPTFQKHAGQSCGGVFIVPMDLHLFQPLRVGLAVVLACRNLLGRQFHWRTEKYEFVEHIPAIDLLFGSDRERKAIEANIRFEEICLQWKSEENEFRKRRKPFLLYAQVED